MISLHNSRSDSKSISVVLLALAFGLLAMFTLNSHASINKSEFKLQGNNSQQLEFPWTQAANKGSMVSIQTASLSSRVCTRDSYNRLQSCVNSCPGRRGGYVENHLKTQFFRCQRSCYAQYNRRNQSCARR